MILLLKFRHIAKTEHNKKYNKYNRVKNSVKKMYLLERNINDTYKKLINKNNH